MLAMKLRGGKLKETKEKRLPFTEKTNFNDTVNHATISLKKYPNFNPLSATRGLKQVKLKNSNRKPISKVITNIDCDSNITNIQKKLKNILLADPKFGLNLKVHIERLNLVTSVNKSSINNPVLKLDSQITSNNKSSNLTKTFQDLVSVDPKFGLNVKVHVLQSNLTDPVNKKHNLNMHNKNLSLSLTYDKKSCEQSAINSSHVSGLPSIIADPKGNTLKSKESKNVKLPSSRKINSSGVGKRNLRRRATKTYTELSSSFKDSPRCPENLNKSYDDHIPVYIQNIPTSPSSKGRDPFEFIPETPNKKKQMKNRRKDIDDISDPDSLVYDKSMHRVLKNIRSRIDGGKTKLKKPLKKKSSKNKMKHQQSTSSNTNGNNVNSLLKPSKPITSTKNTNNVVQGMKLPFRTVSNALDQEMKLIVKRMSDISQNIHYTPVLEVNSNEIDNTFGFGSHETERGDYLPSPLFQNRRPSTPRSKIKHTNKKFIALTSTPLPNKSNTQSKTRKNEPKIQVISDIIISPARKTPARNPSWSSSGSDENLLGFVRNKRQSSRNAIDTPWRMDSLHVSRNPHILYLKDSYLPCYNQEMVLNPELLEIPSPKTPQRTQEAQSDVIQSSILDWLSNNESNRKSNSLKRSPLKESSKDNTPSSQEFNVRNCFGFDSSNEDVFNKENCLRARKGKKLKLPQSRGKPTRLNVHDVKKLKDATLSLQIQFESPSTENKTTKSQQSSPVHNEAIAVQGKDAIGDISSNSQQVDNQSEMSIVELFEDLKPAPLHRSYERKRPRRRRLISVHDDVDEDEDVAEVEKVKRRRKDIRTPAEEAAFNKWAADFNAMCEEVERHSLETEQI